MRVPFPHIFSSICCHFVWSLYSWKRFSPTSVASSLTGLVVSLAVKKPFGFMRTHLSIVGLNSWAYRILFKKTFSIPLYCRLPSSHYSSTSSVSGSGFGPPELVFVEGDRCRSVSFFCTWIASFSSTVLKMLYSSVCFWQICQILDVCSYVYSYVGLLFVPLVYMYASPLYTGSGFITQ